MAWEIDAKTKIIALVGDPIEHSLTPRIQNAALKKLGMNVRNIAFRVPKGFLRDFVKGIKVAGVLGVMVTIPHKEDAFKLADEHDKFAELMGSANLLVFKDSQVVAYSTDGYAASRSLKEAGIDVKGKCVAIVGTGGAGRALAFQFALDGASKLLLFNRTVKRAKKLSNELKRKLGFNELQIFPHDPDLLRSELKNCHLLVNATSVGMHPNEDEIPIPADALHPDLIVFDIVYNPVQTRLLKEAKRKGCKIVDGVPMLVYTNEKALELCLGIKVSQDLVNLMLRACYSALRRRS
ncbi:MAG: shikimate dehydrogenase [Armatimonadota bacterium]